MKIGNLTLIRTSSMHSVNYSRSKCQNSQRLDLEDSTVIFGNEILEVS
jgi:hypothetical protein